MKIILIKLKSVQLGIHGYQVSTSDKEASRRPFLPLAQHGTRAGRSKYLQSLHYTDYPADALQLCLGLDTSFLMTLFTQGHI
ncbi:hypothetical protein E2C01_043122 [Portunus trituberculatus]|uniref:Uncharacterized protein n=1 Tax=Portunus trituberculatus TaxID=210409 RepID=A0A5B7FVG1_PORTR|nr:hypothetical protein [Portunus trituberculatus]